MMLVCTGGSCEVGLLYCDTGGIHDMEMDDFDFCDNLKSPGGGLSRLDDHHNLHLRGHQPYTIDHTTARRNFAEPTANAMLLTLVSSVFAC